MKFGVLGPLQVITGDSGAPGAVSAARLRALLAVLLWRAGQPVAPDELADLVWDGAPPSGASDATRGLVMRLRRQLDQRAAARIVTRPPGYLIEISADELDASQFETLTMQAGTAVRAGQWAQAGRTAARALGLWRGAALADISSQSLRDRWVPHLDQLRVQALDWRIEADLRDGRHEQLIPELRNLTADHPLREHFHGQLMLALYRCGRPGEALEAYRRAREVLVAELGVEPSHGLRELHQRMLAADPALAAAAPTGPGPASRPVTLSGGDPAAPRQLPAGIWHFTGRETELEILTAALEASAPQRNSAPVILAISGTAGVGKTALAVHWAHQHAGRFPDGQLYVDLRGFDPVDPPEGTSTVLRGFLAALGLPPARIPAETGGQIGLYRSTLAGQRMLIMLDNARDSAQVRPLLSGAAGCLVLVTSRSQLTGLIALDGAVHLPVGLLRDQEALDLLTRRLGAERVAGEQAEAAELAALCARLPLALNIASARIVTHPALSLREVCDSLRDARRRLELLSAEPGHADVSAVFSSSYEAISAPAARLFRLLGIHPGPDISLPAAASLGALELDQAGRVLDELTSASLLTEHVPGRYALHDLLRAYAAGHAHAQDTEEGLRSALGRVLDHYLRAAYAAAVTFSRGQPPRLPGQRAGVIEVRLDGFDQAVAWCQAELAVLAAAINCAASSGFVAHAWQLAWATETIPDQWRRWRDQVAVGEVTLAAAGQAGDLYGQAYSHRHLGRALTVGGDHSQARHHLLRAQVLFSRLGDRANQAETELALALILIVGQEPARALARCWHAQQVYQAAGDRFGQAVAVYRTGWAHTVLGRYELGLATCEQALELARDIDGPFIGFVRSSILDSIGIARHHLGRHDGAIASYRQAVDMLHSVGEVWLTARPLDHLGDTHYAAGDPDSARDAWEQAISVFEYAQLPGADEVRQKVRQLDRR